jgi:hypothetical protein
MTAHSVQVALAVTLLVGAGLLLRSFQELGRILPGFEVSRILTLSISGNWAETNDFKKFTQRIDRELDELRATPGVHAAATSLFLPGIPGDSQVEVKISEGRSEAEGKLSLIAAWSPTAISKPCRSRSWRARAAASL